MLRNVLSQTLIARKVKPAALARELGLKTSTLDDILKGRVDELKIGVDKALRIADWIGKSVEEIYERKSPTLSDVELELLSCFRALNTEGQTRVSDNVRDLIASGNYEKDIASGLVQENT